MNLGARLTAVLGSALVLALGAGCQLVVNLDDLNSGQCKEGTKRCDNRCVSVTDPATGCEDPNSCAPCGLPHATSRCEGGLCTKLDCIPGYGDCDDSVPGCETDLAHEPKHCGGCDKPECTTANGIPGCSAGQCATGGCNKGWEDCDHDWTNGCERPVGTDSDCAGCDLPCAAGMSCTLGMCL